MLLPLASASAFAYVARAEATQGELMSVRLHFPLHRTLFAYSCQDTDFVRALRCWLGNIISSVEQLVALRFFVHFEQNRCFSDWVYKLEISTFGYSL